MTERLPHDRTTEIDLSPLRHVMVHRMPDDQRRRFGPPLLGVGAVLLDNEGHVLLVQRGQAPAKGKWSIPGGLVERGERLIEACIREVQEETGLVANLHPQPVKILERVLRDQTGHIEYHYVIVDFWGQARDGILRPSSDVTDARWVAIERLDALPTTEGLLEVVRRAWQLSRAEKPNSPLLE